MPGPPRSKFSASITSPTLKGASRNGAAAWLIRRRGSSDCTNPVSNERRMNARFLTYKAERFRRMVVERVSNSSELHAGASDSAAPDSWKHRDDDSPASPHTCEPRHENPERRCRLLRRGED